MAATVDWGALYVTHADAVAALATGLDDDALATWVPATPAWTVRDVLAHVAGVAADNLSGRTDGAPGPEWTSQHVAQRRALAVADVAEELVRQTRALAPRLTAGEQTPGVVWDLAVHHADLHEALDRGRLPEPLWRPVLEARVARVAVPDGVAAVEPYELFRALFSSRSLAQLRAWGSELDDEALVALGPFGVPGEDQPVPA